MTTPQILSFGLILGTVAVFAWGRFRYDLVALGALVVGLALGIVPAKKAFDGLSDDITVIIASALIVSAAVARSGAVEVALRPLLGRLPNEKTQAPVLAALTALLSMVTKNVGALAILMPPALQLARRTGSAPSRLLMPMSFAALLGGMVTLVGTSPNIIVSGIRQDILGKPFGMYDYAPVGLILTFAGLAFLVFGYRLLPAGRKGAETMDAALAASTYVTEAEVPDPWPAGPMTIAELRRLAGDDIEVTALERGTERRDAPHANSKVEPGDRLVLSGPQEVLNQLIAAARLSLHSDTRPAHRPSRSEDILAVEAVVQAGSSLAGQSARRLAIHSEHGVTLMAVARSGQRLTRRLHDTPIHVGDVLMLQGAESVLPGVLTNLGLLPLAQREVRLGDARWRFLPIIILAAAMILVAMKIVPVAIAFFGAAVLMIASRSLTMREAYQALDAPVLILVAALIPVSETVQSTGGTALIAQGLAHLFHGLPPMAALAATMVVAMAATPFLNNAATVLIIAPVGADLAQRLHLNPDPFLMAVAVGAACDFLTPIGHQCNTLIMAPGGYRFGDYPRLGAPLSVLVVVLGVPLITFFWPLAG
ncbi:di/tricarboxylate transporter [Caulobacter ginsengisoli]|uniref:Di/tricarboxylate transporter n=1 Tax=Caulobacter ginsengisoli TaxID=400775 RepID=A0ABU0IX07_9CAUL|nr:SLC13 family permease [Caulobacter ginsengisoli]MDQ0466539.1 di/tricarboxylate transporter [Caulobacter ginsengisoli]